MDSNEQAIRALHADWMEAVNAGDIARLLSLMTEDVVFLNPGRAPFGREGFPAGFLAAHQKYSIHCHSALEEIEVVGTLAYTLCRDALSLTPRTGGKQAKLAGHRITIYRQQPDGRWLLARDVHTLAAQSS